MTSEIEDTFDLTNSNGENVSSEPSDVETLVKNSPFLDIYHPITIYELTKLIVMFPVVVCKASLPK